MADNTQVIQEFLASLGFKVDEPSYKKFVGSLGLTTNAAATTAKTLLGIGIAAEAMVVSFASSMEKLYYASRRTGASVENLQALEFGSRKIGLAAGQAQSALESMAAATRMNPGLRSVIDGLLGKDTAKLDQAQVMIELVQKLATMPHYQGAQYASMFGMDEKTFLMLKQGLPELIKAEEERRNMNRQANIDAQAAAEAGKEYANSITDITTRLGVLRDRVAIEMLPSFREFNREIIHTLDNLNKFKLSDHPRAQESLQVTGDTINDARRSVGGYTDFFGGLITLDGKQMKRGLRTMWDNRPGAGAMRNAEQRAIDRRSATGKIGHPTTGPKETTEQLFGRLEKENSLPPGLLDRVYAKESGRGKYMDSPKGAQGPFGFMPSTSKEYGVKNPYDLAESATASAHKWHDLLKRYNGNAEMAAAAYNWGDGNLQKFGMKNEPFETRDYVASVAGKSSVVMNQKTDIHVAGGDSPTSTARSVATEQRNVNSELVRNLQGAVQ